MPTKNNVIFTNVKGQIKPKVGLACRRFCKKTNKQIWFDLFAVKSKKANKTNSFVHFLGESTARKSAFGFIWPLAGKKTLFLVHISNKSRSFLFCHILYSFKRGDFEFYSVSRYISSPEAALSTLKELFHPLLFYSHLLSY